MILLTDGEVEHARSLTPGVANVLHFNHAGASLLPQPVIDTTIGHLRREAEIGGYEAADEAGASVDAVYRSISELINARPNEIAIVENATRGWDMAFYAIPFRKGDRILTSASEYASNVIAFMQVARKGVSVEVVPNDERGQISLESLVNMLDERVRVVGVSHMPTNGGLVQPAGQIGRLAREAGAIFLLDACQTVGQMPIDVAAMNVDILSATSRKYLRGPRGAGFLYVRETLIDQLVPPFLDLHAARWTSRDAYEIRPDARRFENWERSIANLLGMGAAVDYARSIGLVRIWNTLHHRAETLRSRLRELPGVTVHDLGAVKGGIVTFDHDTVSPDEISTALKARSINTVTSSVFSTRYDMEARGLAKLVRASVHYLTTDDEIDKLVRAVAGITAGA